MKKILFLLLLTASANSQALFDKGIKITGGIATENTATKVVVQSANNVLNTISKSDLVNVEPYASAVNLPVTGLSGKIYITNDDNKIYRWNGTIYQPLSITGTGTTNFLPKFTGASTLGNSMLSDSGGILNVSGSGVFSSSVTANGILNSQNRLLLTGSNPLSSWISSAITSGYDSNTSQGYFNADGSLLLSTNGVSRLTLNSAGATFSSSVTANSLAITTAPITSSGTPPILTYNAATKAIESVPYNNVAAAANAVLLTGAQSATGRKTFNSDNTTVGGINLINSRTTNTGGTADSNGILVINSGSSGILVEANANSGIVAKSINTGTTGILVESFSSGTGLSLRNQGGTGDLLNAEVGVTRITSAGKLITTATPTATIDVTNKLYVDNKVLYNSLSKTANYTVLITDFIANNELIISVNASAASVTITLPTFTILRGYKVIIKKMDSSANSVLIQGVGGINIDGSSSLVVTGQYSKSSVGADANQYIIL